MKRTTVLISLFWFFATGCSPSGPSAMPAGGSGTASGISWTQFVDPAEHAFTMQVPRGWKVVGGAYRFGPLDPRAMVDMTAPDGKTNLRFGDANVPPFTTLSATMRSLGWHEGRQYSPNGVAREVVANYRPGWVFADLYGQARFSPLCQSLRLKEMKQLPPIHESPGARTTAGEVLYTCDTAAGPKAAYVFAETQMTQMQSVKQWMVSWLYSFITPADQAPEAMKTILHSMGTFEIDQQWEAQQLRISGAAADTAYTQFKQNMALEHDRFTKQSAQFQNQVDGFTRAFRGVDLTTDTVDGTQREVWAGTGGTHWMSPLGDAATSPTSPGAQFHPLRTDP
jgi:hypothetical protein